MVFLVPHLAGLPGRNDSGRAVCWTHLRTAIRPAKTSQEAKDYDLVVIHTSTPSLRMDVRTAEAIKAANPNARYCFRRRPSDGAPRRDPQALEAIDIAARKEFDHSMVEVAQGMDWSKIGGISYRRNGVISHNPDRPSMTDEELDKLPFVTEVYEQNLDYLRYNSPYCQYPYVSMYTGRGCPARCTFCLWPQVTQGHQYRVRSPENVLRRSRRDEVQVPQDEGTVLRRRHLHRRPDARAQNRPIARSRSGSPGRPTRAPTSITRLSRS